jgi:4'-phosphopantetheinyl transferase EntD
MLGGAVLTASALLAAVLPAQAVGVAAEADDWNAALLPDEEPMIARAVPRRRREVAAGRTCARRAMARLGREPVPLPADPNRVPRWPPEVVGSITHTREFCAAAVAWRRDLHGLGLDAERAIDPSRGDIMRLVATPAEAAWLAGLGDDARPTASAVLFSAKEAFYKCQYPLTREFLDFSALELAVEIARGDLRGGDGVLHGVFRAGTRAGRDLPPLGARYVVEGDLVITAAFLAA